MMEAMAKAYLALLGAILISLNAAASPYDELSSLDPTVRSKAAQQIREQHLFHPSPRNWWKWSLASLKRGQSGKEALAALQASGVAENFSPTYLDSFSSGVIGFRLDDTWMLKIAFQSGRVVKWKLVSELRVVMVFPPPGYNGDWWVYRVDGHCVILYFIDGVSTSPLKT